MKTKTAKSSDVERTIYKMLTESTGTHFLDSGGDSGRNWQRNQKKKLSDFKKEDAVTYEGDGAYTISLFHYLTRSLELDPISKEFNRKFVPAKDWEAEDSYGLSKAGEDYLKEFGFKFERTFNSYNGDSNLSQVIQGSWYEFGDRHYLLLQIHQGADVRGGYTDARLFYVPGYEDGALSEDVYGNVTREDGSTLEVSNGYNGYSLTTEDGKEIEFKESDKVALYLSEI
jgi:hypothetical protein